MPQLIYCHCQNRDSETGSECTLFLVTLEPWTDEDQARFSISFNAFFVIQYSHQRFLITLPKEKDRPSMIANALSFFCLND